MKYLKKITGYLLAVVLGILTFAFIQQKKSEKNMKADPPEKEVIKYDDTRIVDWPPDFSLVEIPSENDSTVQKAYFYKTTSDIARPLVVSLHTWSGNYTQVDPLALMCKSKDLNYIHPDFRGENNRTEACCSEMALSDIDAAIGFALQNSNTDTSAIYVIGVSGGGYATLATFMKSRYHIRKFSAWASITNLVTWYNESKIRGNKYAGDILLCTGSNPGVLNIAAAKDRSPYFWVTPVDKLNASELSIYAGIYDGIQGSVPITQSINFYNKILSDMNVTDPGVYISDKEKLLLLEKREPLADMGEISGRKIILKKEYKHLKIILFEGNHEMLPEYAFTELLTN